MRRLLPSYTPFSLGNRRSVFFGDIQQYNTLTQKWNTLYSELPGFTPKANHAAVVVGDRLWVIGGSNNESVHPEVGYLDLKTLRWEAPAIR